MNVLTYPKGEKLYNICIKNKEGKRVSCIKKFKPIAEAMIHNLAIYNHEYAFKHGNINLNTIL